MRNRRVLAAIAVHVRALVVAGVDPADLLQLVILALDVEDPKTIAGAVMLGITWARENETDALSLAAQWVEQ